MPKIIITYGTFDMFHIGHLKLSRKVKVLYNYEEVYKFNNPRKIKK